MQLHAELTLIHMRSYWWRNQTFSLNIALGPTTPIFGSDEQISWQS